MAVYKVQLKPRKKDPPGKKRYAWMADYSDASGKRIRKQFKTQQEAKDAESTGTSSASKEKILGVKIALEKIFNEIADEFEKNSEVNVKPETHRANLNALKTLRPFFGKILISHISEKNIDDYIVKRAQTVKPASVNRDLAVLKHILKLAKRWNYLKDVPEIKMMKGETKRLRYLTSKEIEKLLKECAYPLYLYTLVQFALNTGARKSEALNITWDRINFDTRLIHLEDTKHNRRDIPMNDILFEVLTEYKKKAPNTEKLFSVGNPRKAFDNAKEDAGIKDFTFHDLRHTFASHLVMQGTDLATVSKLLGHASIEMTMRYVHLSPDHRRLAVDRISNLVASNLPVGKFRNKRRCNKDRGKKGN